MSSKSDKQRLTLDELLDTLQAQITEQGQSRQKSRRFGLGKKLLDIQEMQRKEREALEPEICALKKEARKTMVMHRTKSKSCAGISVNQQLLWKKKRGKPKINGTDLRNCSSSKGT